jgi:hypothetical protein
MNRLTITQLSALALSAGLLFACKMQKGPAGPTGADSFLAEVLTELGKGGRACFEAEGQDLCLAKAAQPVEIGDRLGPDQDLVLCTKVGDELTDCKDVRSDPSLGVEYVCSNGMCYCEGVASCTLMAAECGPAGGTCGECAVGDCCCLDPDVDMPD